MLINNLKMRCNILRLPDDKESYLDDYGSYNPDFQLLYSDVKCYFQFLRMASGKLLINQSGQQPEDTIIGFFQKDADVKIGDRIYCSNFYPNDFYIQAVNPIINGRTGSLSHFEITGNIERTN